MRIVFQPISRVGSSNQPFLCYVEKFSFAGKIAADGGREEELNVDMYLLRRQFRSQAGDGPKTRIGDIIQLTDIVRSVDIVPVFGARKDPHITEKNSLDVPMDFFLNCFSDKEIYHSILTEFS